MPMKAVRHMLRLPIAMLLAATLAACAAPDKRQGAGEYVDDAWITSKVKGAFVKNADLSAAEIHVNTYKGEVQLSGFVSDAGDVGKAAAVAGGIEGVKSVRNDLQVKSAKN
jgi:osmotically-inducible protein OsmY